MNQALGDKSEEAQKHRKSSVYIIFLKCIFLIAHVQTGNIAMLVHNSTAQLWKPPKFDSSRCSLATHTAAGRMAEGSGKQGRGQLLMLDAPRSGSFHPFEQESISTQLCRFCA
ncbi:Hypothetical predicted protein [Scomber scombrus]|uniref:Uncharacterized protein n=1 Tax=Scomber scombrus TaxID=13677 RepID=A0AAV1PCK0_SCOSC